MILRGFLGRLPAAPKTAAASSNRRAGMINLLQHPAFESPCEITAGILQDECGAILQSFFQKKRAADAGDS